MAAAEILGAIDGVETFLQYLIKACAIDLLPRDNHYSNRHAKIWVASYVVVIKLFTTQCNK
jgi:hypothetical protein